MKFRRADPNTHYRSLRLLSESGRWELGMSPYHHGMRLRMGLAGQPPQALDVCMGTRPEFFPKLLLAVLRQLETLAEVATSEEVDAVFPWAGTRPDLSAHAPFFHEGHWQFERAGP